MAIALGMPLTVYADGGESCENATTASSGIEEAQLNVANHTGDIDQWYTYTATRDGMITVSSCGFTETGTHVAIYTSCEAENPIKEIYGNCSGQTKITYEATTGDVILIRWYNPTNAEAEKTYSWSLVEADAAEGESCSAPITANDGTNTCTALWNLSQWFVYTATTTGKVDVTSCESGSNAFKRLNIYEACDGDAIATNYYKCDENNPTATFGVEEGHDYYIEWINKSSSASFDWTLTAGDWAEGENCSTAKEAQIGDNTCTDLVSYEEWFSYVPSVSGTITVTNVGLTDEDSRLSIYADCDSEALYVNDDYVVSDNEEESIKQSQITFEGEAGTTYYFKWDIYSNASSEGFPWSVSETAYTEGGTCTMAIAATLGSDNVADHSAQTDQWFTYTPDFTGYLVVTTRDLTTVDTKIMVYTACGSDVLVYNDDIDLDNGIQQSEVTFECSAGQEYLIQFSKRYANESSYNWSLQILDSTSIKDPKKGNNISIFPNPTDSRLNIQSDYEITEVKIYSIAGELVLAVPLTEDYLDLDLKPGLYVIVLKLEESGIEIQKKLIIK